MVYLTLGLLLAEAHANRSMKAYFLALGAVMTLAVGLSRIHIGVHYPTDVIAGWSLGTAWALICWAAYSVFFRHDQRDTPV